MFWRFGFHNASSIDSLLDKEDVSLEAILNEDDLIQECKAQNTRLIDYFQRVDVLQRLLGYVSGRIEGEDERSNEKYPYMATEVLCSDIWCIVETCISRSDQLLTPFWETVLEKPPEEYREPTKMALASYFAKVNAVFLNKKPAEMFAFIQGQTNIVDRLLRHIETPAFADLLVRVIQLDEVPSCAGVLEWLSKENLMSRLLDFLAPVHSRDKHTVVAELIKGIISMAAPSPAAGLGEGPGAGIASNRFARELASPASVAKLVGYITTDYKPPGDSATTSTMEGEIDTLPNQDSTTSSVVQSICIIIELIRQNNSDYFEPYLFHTLRNRLIQVQQHLHMHTQDGRETLERAMTDMVNRMGVVHLGPVLEMMCDKLDELQKYLRTPRSQNGAVLTTVGSLAPLTFERYRICELYAELLHCSNMSLLNRPPEYDHLYDSEGRLQGGLSALEELAQVIAIGAGNDGEDDDIDDENEEMEPAHEFPVSAAHTSSSLDSDDDMSDDEPGSSDDDAMDEIAMYEEPRAAPMMGPTGLPETPLERFPSATLSSSPMQSPSLNPAALTSTFQRHSSASDSETSLTRPRSRDSRRSRRSVNVDSTPGPLVLGERLKLRFLEANVASTLLDLFFEFPWNNFIHSVVYDLIHQVLTGRIDTGYNRELTISLFRDARLIHRIIEGSKRNDVESSRPKGVRLGYMGHLTLVSEDVIGALEHFPPDLRLLVAQYAPQPAWDEYVSGRYKETKKRDSELLGGGKPVVAGGMRAGAWRVDEADAGAAAPGAAAEEPGEEGDGGFRRGARAREGSADFAAGNMDEDEDEFHDGPPHFAHYLAQEMQPGAQGYGGGSSDEDEDESGWLAHSTFDLRPPPVQARQHDGDRRPLGATGFDDVFDPGSSSGAGGPFADPFDDDTFGPFSDAAAAAGDADPFAFPSSLSEELAEDTSFDGFSDFGDFQSAGGSGSSAGREGRLASSGSLTPTADSWSFASISSTGSEEGSIRGLSESPQDKEVRTA